jgi:hypothetical protein
MSIRNDTNYDGFAHSISSGVHQMRHGTQ